ncbi:MAG: hypothetical protein JWN44_3183 [Myxococcales bacterium]|nr:hypothetical protein [Myxococcales bacterium]
MSKKLLLTAIAAVSFCACTYPQETKMEAVGEKQMETQKKQPPPGEAAAPTEATSTTEAAAQSSSATH